MFTNQTIVNSTIPAMAVRGIVPLPNNEIRLEVGRVESIQALKKAASDKKFIALFVQKNPAIDTPGLKDIESIGIVARIIYDMDTQGLHKVKLQGIVRCQLNDLLTTEPNWLVDITTLPSESTNMDKELAMVRLLIEELEKGGQKLFDPNNDSVKLITKG